jgi:hypothetical protein
MGSRNEPSTAATFCEVISEALTQSVRRTQFYCCHTRTQSTSVWSSSGVEELGMFCGSQTVFQLERITCSG